MNYKVVIPDAIWNEKIAKWNLPSGSLIQLLSQITTDISKNPLGCLKEIEAPNCGWTYTATIGDEKFAFRMRRHCLDPQCENVELVVVGCGRITLTKTVTERFLPVTTSEDV